MSKLRYLVICSIALAIGLLSCTEEPAIVAVISVTLDSTSLTLVEGDNQTLTATVSPSNAENQKVLWSSSNSSVASVKEGVVTAVKVGTATITAKSDDGGKTATCEITVNAKVYPVTGVTLNKTSYEMTEGDEVTLTATVSPENATNKNVSWSSSNTSVATVENGKIKALKAGSATITVKTEDGNKTATCEITVNAKVYPVTGVTLDKTSYEMTEGDEVTLTATVSPENATNKNVSWSSSNTSVATVENGKIKALKAGPATITVKTEDGNKTATCEITVNAKVYPVESISLDKVSVELTEGEDIILNAKITPSNATNKNVIWSSSDNAVASVKNGKVTAIKKGTCTITATTEDGNKTASCEVIVTTRVAQIYFYKNSLTLAPETSYIMPVDIIPMEATNKKLFWSSANENIAVVSQEGKITAKSSGKTIIYAKAIGGAQTTCNVEVIEPGFASVDYIDEYNINHGKGVAICGTVWAPVNCGYKEATLNDNGYPYGKLYQWGRKYGQGYDANDATYPSGDNIYEGPVQPSWGLSEDYKDVFFCANQNWCETNIKNLWNDNGAKTLSDPCPDGWRVPTERELDSLVENHSEWTTNANGQMGYFFSGKYDRTESIPEVFLPAAGEFTRDGVAKYRGTYGYYWTSNYGGDTVNMLTFSKSSIFDNMLDWPACGKSIRCVQE